MVKFRSLSDVDGMEFKEAMDIYVHAFPSNERHPVEVIRQRVKQGVSELYIGFGCRQVVFMALLYPLQNTDFILLDYMAAKPAFRGKKISTSFLTEMRSLLSERKTYFLLEVEHPAYGENKEERLKRYQFYRRSGAQQLKNVRYVLPPLQGTLPTEMMLLILPRYKTEKIPASVVKALIVQLYKELYRRENDDPLLLQSLHSVHEDVDVI